MRLILGYAPSKISGKVSVQMNEMFRRFEDNVQLYYGAYFTSQAITARQEEKLRKSVPLMDIIECIDHALTSPTPHTRYLVGKQAFIARVGSFLSDWTIDWVSKRMYWPAKYTPGKAFKSE